MPSPFYTTTPHYGLRALLGNSNVSDIDAGFLALATDVENSFGGYRSGTHAARLAATATDGLVYRETDTGTIWLGTGAGWVLLGSAPARAYANATYGPFTNYITVPLDTVSFGSGFDTTNHRFVAPATGYYQCMGNVALSATSTPSSMFAALIKNGTEISRGTREDNAQSGFDYTFVVSDIVQLTAGDFLTLSAFSSVSTSSDPAPIRGLVNYLSVRQVA